MRAPRLSLLVGFVVLDGLGVGAFLLDDALGGGWAADVLAVALVIAGIGLVVFMTGRYLAMADNPTPEEAAREERRDRERLERRRARNGRDGGRAHRGLRRVVHRRV